MSATTTPYINNKDFIRAIAEYREALEYGGIVKTSRAADKLCRMFFLIAINLLNKPNFIRYSPERKDEMVSDAMLNMYKYSKNFKLDTKYPNPFGYFTRVAINTYRLYCKKQKKHSERSLSLEMLENGANSASMDR
jgi:hypothetical protein